MQAQWDKYLVFVASVVGLYWLMRRISAPGQVQYPPPTEGQDEVLSVAAPFAAVAPALPPAPELGPIRILNMYFAGFDLAPGPADPKKFSDELFLDLENVDTGFGWVQSFQVATPHGLASILEANGWRSAFIDSLLLVARYDLTEIWHAVVERLVEEQRLTHAGGKGPPVAGI